MSDYTEELRHLARDLTANDPAPWAQMRELGLDRVGIDEDRGGSGGDVEDLVTVVRAFAAAGVLTPLVDASVGAHVRVDGELRTGYGALAHAPATLVATGGTLSGTLEDVPDSGADHLVLFRDEDALVVELTGPGVRTTPLAGSVAGESLMTVTLDGARCNRFDGGYGRSLWEQLELEEMLAHARAALDLTRAWVKQRQQFGRPLVALPAVAARLADMAVQMRLGEAALVRVDLSDADHRAHRLASARLVVGQCATVVARTAHQLHGAMGITAEYPLHRHTRAIWSRRDRARHRSQARTLLTTLALRGGESALWDDLTGRR